ncbi:MAG: hypothetical protein JRF62_07615 [Deltaproteobacteria bacterium]|nr:hypothetical protein [Deltaproteobacteria bacterium]MBW2641232.1 hypothetical protein [Deltaproteobacteria bacterium]MBW2679650.1 hypothetical protein [Deltaproteobacteria bacterium]RLC11202.1 MAG: hypothetical protein DRI24_19135 [Deltaproteobacteria bacterium]
MLIIREEQMEVFRKYMCRQFENRMVLHLSKYFPEECKALGEQRVRNTIRYGIERAKTYGIVIQNDVGRYTNLMFTFGRDFDKDPTLPWAGEVLNDEDLGWPTRRMDVLYEKAAKHLPDAVAIHGQNAEAQP